MAFSSRTVALLSSLLLHLLPSCRSSAPVDPTPLFYNRCGTIDDLANPTFASRSAYSTNIDDALASLKTSSSSVLYSLTSNGSVDRIFASYQCRGDLNFLQCSSCISVAITTAYKNCPNSIEARIELEACSLQYQNSTVVADFTSLGAFDSGAESNNPSFLSTRSAVLTNVSLAAPFRPYYFSSASLNDTVAVFAIAQCNGYLNSSQCLQCLADANNTDKYGLSNQTGGRIILGSCMYRYETSLFYGETTVTAPSPALALAPAPALEPVTGSDDHLPSKQQTTGERKNDHAVIGAVVGSFLLIGVLFIFFVLWFRSKRKHTHNRGTEELESRLQQHQIRIFTPQHMKAATRNYHNDNKLGQGGFGSVYKGTLQDGQVVAVKRLSHISLQGERQFLSEVEAIANIKHRNVIKLLGCCVDGSDRLLIYEYLPNRSLDNHIFDAEQPLTWSIRREIILGTAKGLAYLHHEAHKRIVHRDVKPVNILLDDNLNPIIADFGLARLFACDQTHVSTQIAGTIGYFAPEYAMHGQLTERSDTYSFGLVILEIISGRRVIEYGLPQEQQSLLSWTRRLFQDKRQLEILDPLLKDNYIREEVLRVVHVALLCTQLEAESRPTMSKAVMMLEGESEMMDVPATPALKLGTELGSDSGSGYSLETALLSSGTATSDSGLFSSTSNSHIVQDRSNVCVDSIFHELRSPR